MAASFLNNEVTGPSDHLCWDELGPRPWLVLGGGGLRGLCHIGVWRWLRETGRSVHGVIGCSIGALVGACIAGGMDVRELMSTAQNVKKDDILRMRRSSMLPGGLKAPSVFHGSHYRAFLERFLPTDAWPDMVLPVHVNAVDLATGNQEWFGDGGRQDLNVLDAVYASSALPGVFPPVRSGDQSLIDGGFYQALPMDRSLETTATGILAIDVGSGPVADLDVVMEQGMVGIQQRASSIMIRENRMDLISRWNGLPTVLLRPNLDGYGNFDFDSVDYFLAEGYRAAKARLT